MPSLSRATDKSGWSGVIFEGDAGQVYGSPTLTADAEIPSGKTLTIPAGTTLTIPDGVTLTNSGTITNNGAITGDSLIGLSPNAAIQTGSSPRITVGAEASATGDGRVTVSGGGSVTIEEGGLSVTVTVPSGGGTITPQDGGVQVPPGCAVRTEAGPEITVNSVNGTVGTDGSITVGTGGSVTVQGTGGSLTITGTGTFTPQPDGGVEVPDGSRIEVGTEPKTTITIPSGGAVTPTAGGGVEVPGGATVKTGDDGPELTVGPGNGGTVGGDGDVTVPAGGTVQVGGSTVTLPGGGTVRPNPDGTLTLPGGATVETGGETVTVPEGGGAYDPGDGTLRPETHTVAFDSQGGSAVDPAAVSHGGTVAKPADPVRSGYTFGGWYKESGCTAAWNFDTDTVTGDVTLYARWTQNSSIGGGPSGSGWYVPPAVSPVTYPITIPAATPHGKLTVSPVRAECGAIVTITVTPEKGWRLDALNVTSGRQSVPLTEQGGGKYTLAMPADTVYVEAVFVSAETQETSWSSPFADVAEGAWYYDAVRFVSEDGLMEGCGNGLFGVNDHLSRGQLAQILFNREGRPVVNYLLQYGDVATGAWYTEAVRWASSQGIADGYDNGNFGPDDPITREQLAVMLWRYSGSPAAADKEMHFNDADEISGFALEAVRWAVENGIINGGGDGRLAPRELATRAQTAQMLLHFLKKQDVFSLRSR